MSRKTHIAIAAYATCAALTFGHVFNANYVPPRDCGPRPHSIEQREAYDLWSYCEFDMPRPRDSFMAGFPAAYAAALWPIYWLGRAGIAATATPTAQEGD